MSNVDRIRKIIGKNTESSNNDRINHIRSILKKPESEPETNTPSRLAKMPLAGAANAVETMVNIPASILNLMVPIVSERLSKVIPSDQDKPVPHYSETDLITKGTAKLLGISLKKLFLMLANRLGCPQRYMELLESPKRGQVPR